MHKVRDLRAKLSTEKRGGSDGVVDCHHTAAESSVPTTGKTQGNQTIANYQEYDSGLHPIAGDSISSLVDVIAVHGLQGHFVQTWTHKSGFFWLKDGLGAQAPYANVFSYGYDSRLAFSDSVARIEDKALEMVNRISLHRLKCRREGAQVKPIVFIGHSLGGILIKKALILAHERSSDLYFKDFLENVRAVAFLGVPHKGAAAATWAKLAALVLNASLADKAVASNIVDGLSKDSTILVDISKQFVDRAKNLTIYTFFETRTYSSILVVKEESARLGLPNEKIFPIDANHIELSKIPSLESEMYAAVAGWITELLTNVVNESSTSHEMLRQSCIQSFSFQELDKRYATIDAPEKGTCEWLQKTPHFVQWLQSDNEKSTENMFWLKGKPGSGKSVLLKRTEQYIRKQNPNDTILRYFFHARGQSLEASCEGLFRTLIHQLVQQERDACSIITTIYKQKIQTLGEGWCWIREEMQAIFRDVLIRHSSISLFIIIDALDECPEDEARALVDFLVDMQCDSTRHIRILITSRHTPHIQTQCIDQIVEGANHEDINLYVENRIPESIDGQDTRDLRHDTVRKASGLFLWAVLAVGIVRVSNDKGLSYEKILERLQNTPSKLELLFDDIIDRIDSDDQAKVGDMLVWFLSDSQPISSIELMSLIECEIPPNYGESSQQLIDLRSRARRYVRAMSAGLLETVENPYRSKSLKLRSRDRFGFIPCLELDDTVQFIHESVRQYCHESTKLRLLNAYQRNEVESGRYDRTTLLSLKFLESIRGFTEDILSCESLEKALKIEIQISMFCAQHGEEYLKTRGKHYRYEGFLLGRLVSDWNHSLAYSSEMMLKTWCTPNFVTRQGYHFDSKSSLVSPMLAFFQRYIESPYLSFQIAYSPMRRVLLSLFHNASKAGQHSMAQSYLVDFFLKHGSSAALNFVHAMLCIHHVGLCKHQREKCMENYNNDCYSQLLGIASAHGLSDFVRQLLTMQPVGLNIDARCATGDSSLTMALAQGYWPVAHILADGRADCLLLLNLQCRHWAFRNKDRKLLQTLAQQIHSTSFHNKGLLDTLLAVVIKNGGANAVEILVSSIGSLHSSNLSHIIEAVRSEVEETAAIIKVLLRHDAQPNFLDSHGRCPLHYAAIRDNAEVIGLLKTAKADVNMRDKNLETPLDYAILAHSDDSIELLQSYGARRGRDLEITKTSMNSEHDPWLLSDVGSDTLSVFESDSESNNISV